MAVKLVQHIPAFVETDKPARLAEGNTLAELLADSWPQRWADEKGFYRFSQDKTGHGL